MSAGELDPRSPLIQLLGVAEADLVQYHQGLTDRTPKPNAKPKPKSRPEVDLDPDVKPATTPYKPGSRDQMRTVIDFTKSESTSVGGGDDRELSRHPRGAEKRVRHPEGNDPVVPKDIAETDPKKSPQSM